MKKYYTHAVTSIYLNRQLILDSLSVCHCKTANTAAENQLAELSICEWY